MLVAFFEVIAVAWFYGMHLVMKFLETTVQMLLLFL